MLLHRHERRASTSNHPSVFSMDAKIDLSAHIDHHETAERLGKVLDVHGWMVCVRDATRFLLHRDVDTQHTNHTPLWLCTNMLVPVACS